MKTIPLIPSIEAIIPLLLENYRNEKDINKREESLREVFIPIAKAADAWQEHTKPLD